MNKHERFHTEPEPEVPQEPYQLYYDEVDPRRYYLSVDGSEAKLIESKDMSNQRRWFEWHLARGFMPPSAEKAHVIFEAKIQRLCANAIKRDVPLPFLQTDADHLEDLVSFFDTNIISVLREQGQKFLDGKVGDRVRLMLDIGRIYFKWKRGLKDYCQRSLQRNQRELNALKMFINKKGGYQGEHDARDWYRCRYWVPLDLFGEENLELWTKLPGVPKSEGEEE
jgi:hypothetical protein